VLPLTTPDFSALQFNGNNLVISGTNGVSDWPYDVLTTTNLALPISEWTVFSTNAFDGAGNFSFTNAVSAASQQYFLLQLQ
jgi:hypothetical protein